MRTRRSLVAVAVASASVLAVALGGLPTTGALFTTRAAAPAQAVHTATLEALTDTSATQGPDGIAHLSWSTPARADVAASYAVQRTVGPETTTITPSIDADESSTRLTDDLTTTPPEFEYKSVTDIGVEGRTTCAVADGAAYCWGANDQGQLGDGTVISGHPVSPEVLGRDEPTAVDTSGVLEGRTVTEIAVGYGFACAVADGAAYCWGENGWGQLGNHSTADSTVPVAVDTSGVLAGRTVTDISAGSSHVCAVADGAAYCWGAGSSGRLGDGGTAVSTVPVPVDTSGVLTGKTVTAVSAGGAHTCASADGRAYCWGYNGSGSASNGYGALGHGKNTGSTVPVAVSTAGVLAGRTVTDVTAGNGFSCAIADGRAYCWGNGFYGTLGRGSQADSTVPVAVDTSGVLHEQTVTSIRANSSGRDVCAVAGGLGSCWGLTYGGTGRVPAAVGAGGALDGRTITAIAPGPEHVCAVAEVVACWGDNGNGQLGTSGGDSALPVVAGADGHGLSTPVCTPGWLPVLAAARCAPGPDVPISYRISYTKAGWSPPSATELTTAWDEES